jgi:hypothetical protein
MKKIMLTATALIFTVALFAQTTGSAPVTAKATPKHELAQNTAKPSEGKKAAKDEKKKDHPMKEKHHKGKKHVKK